MTPEEEIRFAIETINVMRGSYAHIRQSDSEWNATEVALDALKLMGELTENGLTLYNIKEIFYKIVSNCFVILPVPDGCTLYELEPMWSDDVDEDEYVIQGHCSKNYECPHCAYHCCDNFVDERYIVSWRIIGTRFSVIPLYYEEKLKKLGDTVFIDKEEAERQKVKRESELPARPTPKDE